MSFKALIQWSQKEFSELPWRKGRSMYGTLVSEIMLQQTTVGTVKNHFERFLLKFPDLKSLAIASEEELLIAWKGLGYYRRAKNLKKIAEALYRDHNGEFPHDLEALQKISGIGPYTANALVGIGMDKPALAVDANLERVIARLYGLKTLKGPKLQKEISLRFLAGEFFEKKLSARALNEALMDLGRTFCQARKASCELCPLSNQCVAFKQKSPLSFPIEASSAKKAKSQEHKLHLLRIVVRKKNQVLAYKKTEGQWLSGQYEIPTLIISSSDKSLKQYPLLKTKFDPEGVITFKTGITKYNIINSVVMATQAELKKFGFQEKLVWRDADSEESNLSTASIKAINKI